MTPDVVRERCARCRRPKSVCWCEGLEPIANRTRVVLVQHPREARTAIGTARMALVGLSNAEHLKGIDFTEDSHLRELATRPGTALLFPGEGARAPHEFDPPPEHLIVLDGTWPQARKLISTNPFLTTIPRMGFVPKKPGNYRIRAEPAAHCVATIEAIVEVLETLERAPGRFDPLLRAFDTMVDHQLESAAARTEPVRHRTKAAQPWWTCGGAPDLLSDEPNLVAVSAEANAHRTGSDVPGVPELVHLVAERVATGERFESIVAPRRVLAPGCPRHVDLPEAALRSGESVEACLAKFRAFLRPSDRLVTWGEYPIALLQAEGWQPALAPIDVRIVLAMKLKRRPGAPEQALEALGAAVSDAPVAGRAGRRVQDVVAMLRVLLNELAAASPGIH